MSTTAHIDLLVELLADHTWISQAPASVHAGPIPDVLSYPAIGVFAGSGRATDETLDGVEFTDSVDITIASPQDMDGETANQTTLQAMKDEIIALIYAEPHLGDESVVRGTTVQGWERTVVAFERDMGDMAFFEYVTVRYSVRYVMTLA